MLSLFCHFPTNDKKQVRGSLSSLPKLTVGKGSYRRSPACLMEIRKSQRRFGIKESSSSGNENDFSLTAIDLFFYKNPASVHPCKRSIEDWSEGLSSRVRCTLFSSQSFLVLNSCLHFDENN